MRRSRLAFWSVAMLIGWWHCAEAQIVVTPNISELCKAPAATYRKTIVYIDLSAIKPRETEWGLTLLNKLELGPREHLTILGVDPGTFQVTEVLDTCYPTFTREEVEATRAGRGVWDRLTQLDPEAQQRENLQTFEAMLKGSLNKLVTMAQGGNRDGRRNMIGAIALDKNRFRDPETQYRLLLYTNGILNEPPLTDGLGREDEVAKNLVEKYTATFSGAEVYVYGVAGEDPAGRGPDARSRIFSAFLLNSWALLRSYGSSLPQQAPGPFAQVRSLRGTYESGGVTGTAKLVIAPTRGATARAAGWLVFILGTKSVYVPFDGEYACNGNACKLDAMITENVTAGSASTYFRKEDRLTLSGKPSELQGSLKPAARETFKSNNRDVEYSLKFSID